MKIRTARSHTHVKIRPSEKTRLVGDVLVITALSYAAWLL